MLKGNDAKSESAPYQGFENELLDGASVLTPIQQASSSQEFKSIGLCRVMADTSMPLFEFQLGLYRSPRYDSVCELNFLKPVGHLHRLVRDTDDMRFLSHLTEPSLFP